MMTFGNSVLAGLVAITSACSTVYPWAAIIIGIVAGFVYNIGSQARHYEGSSHWALLAHGPVLRLSSAVIASTLCFAVIVAQQEDT